MLVFAADQHTEEWNTLYADTRASPTRWRHRPTLLQWLQEAIAITRLLGTLHSQSILHGDLRSDCIRFTLPARRPRIIDFLLARKIHHQIDDSALALHEGALQFMSPERTGRTSRSVDVRSDFYSLGAIFFDVLTGSPPFNSEDPLELLHLTLARRPPLASDVDNSIPTLLAYVIAKLLEKGADHRYQCLDGLLADLASLAAHCRRHIDANDDGLILDHDLVVGAVDDLARFRIPQTLYARSEQTGTLAAAFDTASQTGLAQLGIVRGASGVGKSRLVGTLQDLTKRTGGYMTSAKFGECPFTL